MKSASRRTPSKYRVDREKFGCDVVVLKMFNIGYRLNRINHMRYAMDVVRETCAHQASRRRHPGDGKSIRFRRFTTGLRGAREASHWTHTAVAKWTEKLV
jgi:hypothetical protein